MNIVGETFYFKKKPSLKTLIGASIGMVGILIIFNDEIFNFSFSEGTHIVSLDDDVQNMIRLTKDDKLKHITNLDTFFKKAFSTLKKKNLYLISL